ncbi:hypothetical protein CYLTODRAFT_419026 [Cylindrobasidium torrendii FP15055 ss-10]|uniref:Nudix hydrolase domain-containing protein n=1 Tax=Cylindrobasidium torrendii FP15055 ss-10 TaxID=1314674 RepID=A0A0D7BLV5_9AGAR|nr:hypothetical protein CYLTODRAFT_419026 [Cylindrobasidium torrendii FP15055 ss-10]
MLTPSASLVVLNANNEVLLVQRHSKASAFADVHVFPGGIYDGEQDNDSLRMTALRETFEETGLLLAAPPGALDTNTLLNARELIHSRKITFPEMLATHHLEPDVEALLPFTDWITPVEYKRRFQTRFFVTFLAPDSNVVATSDGGIETVSAQFLPAATWLSLFNARKIVLMSPQVYILQTLAELQRTSPAGRQSLRANVVRLSRGAFSRMVITPTRLSGLAGKPGQTAVMVYEGDEERGGSPGRRHREHTVFGKSGVTVQVRIERNFDIFTGVELASAKMPQLQMAKL